MKTAPVQKAPAVLLPSSPPRGRAVGGEGTGPTLRRAFFAGLLLASLASGCVPWKGLLAPEEKPPPPVCQIASTWETKVLFAPDPAHGGVPSPGLAGRLYLFGEETGHPLVGDGSVAIDLFDDTPALSGGQPKLLEKWILDKNNLKRLLRRDRIGQGYTLFLPWGTYRPDISHVHLMVCYTTQNGNPLYSPSSSLTLTSDSPLPAQVASRTVVGTANGAGPPVSSTSRFVVPTGGSQTFATQSQGPSGLNVQRLGGPR